MYKYTQLTKTVTYNKEQTPNLVNERAQRQTVVFNRQTKI